MTSSSEMPSYRPISSPGSLKTDGSVRRRIRLSPEQLQILENTFLKNKKPNSKHRKQLAEQLRKPLRSIQIWFQNRRAKEKQAQKENQKFINSVTLQEQISQPLPNNHHPPSPSHLDWSTLSIPEYRPGQDWQTDNYNTSLPLTAQDRSMVRASDPKPFSTISYEQRFAPVITSPSPNETSFNFPITSSLPDDVLQTVDPTRLNLPSPAIELTPQNLLIGTWSQSNDYDKDVILRCAYYPDTRAFEWYIQDSENCFKIVIDAIDRIFYSKYPGYRSTIRIILRELPSFYTKKTVDREWRLCKDFTEDNQASTHFAHELFECHDYETRQVIYTIQTVDPTVNIHMNSTEMTFEPLRVPFLNNILSC